jgi:putative DNA primase/helicase
MNTIDQFKTAMLDAGIAPPDAIHGDGQLHRFNIAGKPNGAYVLHLDGRPAGFFQDFKQGIKQNWKLAGNFKPLTATERQAFAKQCKVDELKRKAEEKARHAEAASRATNIWNHALPAPANHPYLKAKGVNPNGLRSYHDSLVVPLYDENGALVSLQFISKDGSKLMLKNGKAQGACCFIGGDKPEPGGTILLCEGWATGASLYEETGHFVIVAFCAGNLKAVAIQTRKHHPDNEIVICGDNDLSGIGQKTSREAALACGGKYILPPIAGMDFNDYINGGAL